MPTILGANTLSTGYDVENSLRFNDDDTPNLVRTISSGADVTKFTFSFWCKRSTLGGDQRIYSNENTTAKQIYIRFNNNNTFTCYHQGGGSDVLSFDTNAIFRDTTGWYHFHFVMDSTQGTESNRFKMHVNGQQITSFINPVYPSSNEAAAFLNSSEKQNIGYRDASAGGGQHFDGYLAEVALLQGVAEPYTTFGEFDEDSPNIWKPKDFKNDVTFGTNGFYLEFKQTGTSANSSGIGADTSGNDNHFTPNNLAATDQSTDTCTNNACTFNFLDRSRLSSDGTTFSEGNLQITDGSSNYAVATGTLAVTQGKWYWEIKIVASGNQHTASGVVAVDLDGWTRADGAANSAYGWLYAPDGDKRNNDSSSSYGDTYGANDIIGVALDMDNKAIYFSKNGTFQASGDPTSGASKTNAAFTNLTGTITAQVYDGQGAYAHEFSANFGSPAYSISSGNSDANGHGNFEYSVPSGYFALNTKNIAEFG